MLDVVVLLLLFRADCTGEGVMPSVLGVIFSGICLVLFAVVPVEQIAACD